MMRAFAAAVAVLAAAGAAWADDGCSVPQSEWQPLDALQQRLESEGWTIREIKIDDDRMGMLVMTRDREQFARALGRIALDGHRIESVVPADENVDALYEYLIGGESR